ncbi:MAG TPA: MmcQ/YjbR family DNA-binding protein [Catenuloplanes sp.]|jgi:predicted DNA-binding protein (MmcQ/YjbR family)
MTVDHLAEIRRRCLALPRVSERASYGQPAWFAGQKKMFAMLDWRRPAVWCAAPPGRQAEYISRASRQFFRPPYLGPKGWLGIYLDTPGVDWGQVDSLLTDGYRLVAPTNLVSLLDAA